MSIRMKSGLLESWWVGELQHLMVKLISSSKNDICIWKQCNETLLCSGLGTFHEFVTKTHRNNEKYCGLFSLISTNNKSFKKSIVGQEICNYIDNLSYLVDEWDIKNKMAHENNGGRLSLIFIFMSFEFVNYWYKISKKVCKRTLEQTLQTSWGISSWLCCKVLLLTEQTLQQSSFADLERNFVWLLYSINQWEIMIRSCGILVRNLVF